ncbi:uncharacterized protein BX663DRAFT_516561 [Cokeromyces recurvatus]|uniref:uncharacterized protein n=1 Tax=Cokeromyces recurvatus TaxID=90255 RepID=UPI00221FD5BA|nr:uncharacterized protein BX663DRAFT_516561 [Cokeromyces recurvatus]KAI7900796.1 hypothetical protein BX663DRAFT_516561 [Cokeromyces recurvatus]
MLNNAQDHLKYQQKLPTIARMQNTNATQGRKVRKTRHSDKPTITECNTQKIMLNDPNSSLAGFNIRIHEHRPNSNTGSNLIMVSTGQKRPFFTVDNPISNQLEEEEEGKAFESLGNQQEKTKLLIPFNNSNYIPVFMNDISMLQQSSTEVGESLLDGSINNLLLQNIFSLTELNYNYPTFCSSNDRDTEQ